MTSTPTRPVDNVVIATKGLQDRNLNILAGTTVENKGKLILTKELKPGCLLVIAGCSEPFDSVLSNFVISLLRPIRELSSTFLVS